MGSERGESENQGNSDASARPTATTQSAPVSIRAMYEGFARAGQRHGSGGAGWGPQSGRGPEVGGNWESGGNREAGGNWECGGSGEVDGRAASTSRTSAKAALVGGSPATGSVGVRLQGVCGSTVVG